MIGIHTTVMCKGSQGALEQLGGAIAHLGVGVQAQVLVSPKASPASRDQRHQAEALLVDSPWIMCLMGQRGVSHTSIIK